MPIANFVQVSQRHCPPHMDAHIHALFIPLAFSPFHSVALIIPEEKYHYPETDESFGVASGRQGKRKLSKGSGGRTRGCWEHGLDNSWKIWALSTRKTRETTGRASSGQGGVRDKNTATRRVSPGEGVESGLLS